MIITGNPNEGLAKALSKIYPNAINIEEKNIKKENSKFYIIYCGSYFYKPNKDAINFLNQHIIIKILEIKYI